MNTHEVFWVCKFWVIERMHRFQNWPWYNCMSPPNPPKLWLLTFCPVDLLRLTGHGRPFTRLKKHSMWLTHLLCLKFGHPRWCRICRLHNLHLNRIRRLITGAFFEPHLTVANFYLIYQNGPVSVHLFAYWIKLKVFCVSE